MGFCNYKKTSIFTSLLKLFEFHFEPVVKCMMFATRICSSEIRNALVHEILPTED